MGGYQGEGVHNRMVPRRGCAQWDGTKKRRVHSGMVPRRGCIVG